VNIIKRGSGNASPVLAPGQWVKPVVAATLLMSGTVLAVDPAPVRLGDSNLFPEISLTYFSDDNVFRTETNESSATGVIVEPRLRWVADKGVTRILGEYRGKVSRSGISSADADEHELSIGLDTEFSRRSRFSTSLSFTRETEQRGTGLTTGDSDVLRDSNINNDILFNVAHEYGANNARGNLETGLDIRDFSFQNNEALTRNSNFSLISPYVTLSLRTGTVARTFLELRYGLFDFDVDTNDRDEINAFAGIKLNDADRIGGEAKIGVINTSFADSNRVDGSDLGLEISGYIRPVSFSTFILTVERSIFNIDDVTNGASTSAAIKDEFELDWRHQWSNRLSHRVTLNLDVVERDCTSASDLTTGTEAELILNIRRWLDIGFGGRQRERDFDGCAELLLDNGALQSTQQEIFLKIRASL